MLTSAAQASTPRLGGFQTAAATPADDNMTPYRKLAADTLTAFQAHDLAGARKKAKELEKAWDNDQKALQKQNRDVWDQIDKAMDDFIKPLDGKAPDAAKVQAAYDTFIGKLKLAVKGEYGTRD
jgi:wobble nucleotide-excising tRNase